MLLLVSTFSSYLSMSESSEKYLEHGTYGIHNKVLELAFYRGSIPDLIPEIYDFFLFMISEIFVFFFMTHLSSYNNICKTDLLRCSAKVCQNLR